MTTRLNVPDILASESVLKEDETHPCRSRRVSTPEKRCGRPGILITVACVNEHIKQDVGMCVFHQDILENHVMHCGQCFDATGQMIPAKRVFLND